MVIRLVCHVYLVFIALLVVSAAVHVFIEIEKAIVNVAIAVTEASAVWTAMSHNEIPFSSNIGQPSPRGFVVWIDLYPRNDAGERSRGGCSLGNGLRTLFLLAYPLPNLLFIGAAPLPRDRRRVLNDELPVGSKA
jgi:hypothetical protein